MITEQLKDKETLKTILRSDYEIRSYEEAALLIKSFSDMIRIKRKIYAQLMKLRMCSGKKDFVRPNKQINRVRVTL